MSEETKLAVVESDYVDEQDVLVRPGWFITDLPSADWAMGRVAELEAEISENEEMASAAMARVNARLLSINNTAMRGVRFFRDRLAEWANLNRERLLKTGKKKSRPLMNGTIGWRKSGGSLEVQDREALLAWAQAQPVELGLVRIKEEPAIAEIKRYADANSLIPPGMALSPEQDEIQIKPLSTGITKAEH